jgi:multiple sugar transport system substrate-binding protein
MKLRKALIIITVIFFVVPIAFVCLASGKEKGAEPEEEMSWWAQAAKPFKGKTIHMVLEGTPPSNFIGKTVGPMFEEETGVKVIAENVSWGEMYDKEIRDMEMGTGTYDVIYVEQDIIYAYIEQGWLENLSDYMEDYPELLYDDLDIDDFTAFAVNFQGEDGDFYSLPFENFLKTYVYRTDLFNDPEIKKAYKSQYGVELKPAVTYDEYKQIAAFFTKWGKDHNMDLYGTGVTGATHPAAFYEMVENIWPSFALYEWGISDDFKASVAKGGEMNGPKAKQGLKYWVEMIEYAPPEALSATWDEISAAFGGGRTAQTLLYCENLSWVAIDETQSNVAGKVGVAIPPTANNALEDAKAGRGYVGYSDGGGLGIPTTSKNKKAAWLFIQYALQKELGPELAEGGFGPVRESTFNSPKVKELDKKSGGYFTFMKENGHLFKGAPQFPFHAPIREVMMPYIGKAFSGQLTPEEACDQMAEAVDKELNNLGYAK